MPVMGKMRPLVVVVLMMTGENAVQVNRRGSSLWVYLFHALPPVSVAAVSGAVELWEAEMPEGRSVTTNLSTSSEHIEDQCPNT